MPNSASLTVEQIAELRTSAGQFGFDPKHIRFTETPSIYSRSFDEIWIGPNILPESRAAQLAGKTALERMSARAAIAHEGGHRLSVHRGKAFADGSVFDEIQASLYGRTLPGLSDIERFSLLRDAAEKARAVDVPLRELLPLLDRYGWQGLPN